MVDSKIMASLWVELNALRKRYVSYPVKINDDEFVVAPDRKWGFNPKTDIEGLNKYNINKNKWESFISYPSNFQNRNHAVCFNPNDQIVYLVGGSTNTLTHINIKNKSIQITPYKVMCSYLDSYSMQLCCNLQILKPDF